MAQRVSTLPTDPPSARTPAVPSKGFFQTHFGNPEKDEIYGATDNDYETEPEQIKDDLPESFAVWERTILRFLERAIGQGTLIDGLDLKETASYIVATFMGAQQLSFIVSNWADIEDRVRIAATFTVRSIATEEAFRMLDAKSPAEALTRT